MTIFCKVAALAVAGALLAGCTGGAPAAEPTDTIDVTALRASSSPRTGSP